MYEVFEDDILVEQPIIVPKIWQIFIGVNDPKREPELKKLIYSATDAVNVAEKLAEVFPQEGFEYFNQVILRDDLPKGDNNFPSLANVRRELRKLSENVRKDDKILIFISGHGEKINGFTEFCLADENLNSMELIKLINKLEAEVILVLDTCYSGGISFDLPEEFREAARNKTFYAFCSSQGSAYNIPGLGNSLFCNYFIKGLYEAETKYDPSGIKYPIKCHHLYEYIRDKVLKHQDDFNSSLPLSLPMGSYAGRELKQTPVQLFFGSDTPTISTNPDPKRYSWLELRPFLLIDAVPIQSPSAIATLCRTLEDVGFKDTGSGYGSSPCNKIRKLLVSNPINTTNLLILRGELNESDPTNICLEDGKFLKRDDLVRVMAEHIRPYCPLIIILDLKGESNDIVRWVLELNLCKLNEVDDPKIAQCTIAYSNLESNSFIGSLDKIIREGALGLTAVNLITKLQKEHLSTNIHTYLSDSLNVIEVISDRRNPYRSLFWRQQAKELLLQTIDTNKLTQRVGKTFEVNNIYVDLGLQKRKVSSPAPTKGQDPREQEKEEIVKQFNKDEFFKDVIRFQPSKKPVVLVGEPGSGKSTYSKKIAEWLYLNNFESVVIWIPLKKLTTSVRDYIFGDWINSIFGENTLKGKPEIKIALEEQIKDGQVWLILDGWDEFAVEEKDSKKLDNLGNARIVITCRANTYDRISSPLAGASESYCTMPFKEDQTKEFIGKFYNSEPVKGDALIKALDANSDLKSMVSNPLRLTLLCIVWTEQSSLPETFAMLYAEFVELIFKWRQEKEESNSPLINYALANEINEIKDFLGRIAKKGFEAENQYQINSKTESYEDKLLFMKAEEIGWLKKLGSDTSYGFFHTTFQEYFAATAINRSDFFLPENHSNMPVIDEPPLDKNGNIRYRRYRIFESQWQGVKEFWMGRSDIDQEIKDQFTEKSTNFEDGCNDNL